MQIYNQTCKKEIVDEGLVFTRIFSLAFSGRFPDVVGRFGLMKIKLKVVDKYQQLNEIYMKKNYKRKISPGKAHKIPISRQMRRNAITSRIFELQKSGNII